MKWIIITVLLLLFFIPESAFADTNFSLSFTGGHKKGDDMTISSTLSGGDTSNTCHVVEVMLEGVGAGYPFAVDLSNAQISATLNGAPINGHRRYITNPPMTNDLIWHADPSFDYHPDRDKVSIYVSGAKRANVGGAAFGVYLLMEDDQGGSSGYTYCESGYKYYNTVTPLSDSEMYAGNPPTITPKIVTQSENMTLIRDTIAPTRELTPKPKATFAPLKTESHVALHSQQNTSWMQSLLLFLSNSMSTIFHR